MFSRLRFYLIILTLILSSLACQAVADGLIPSLGSSLAPTIEPSFTPTEKSDNTPTFTLSPLPSNTPYPPTSTPIPPSPTPTLTFTPRPTASTIHFQVFEELWLAVNDNYLYKDFNGLDWNAIHEEYTQLIETGLSNEEFYIAMHELVFRLGDEHSYFFSPDEVAELEAEYAGEYDYAGIGVLTTLVPDRQKLVIILIFPGSPAEIAGLQMHDSIIAADGEPVVDENEMRLNLLRGPEGSTVVLTVQTPGQEPRQVSLVRQRISGALPVPYSILTTPQGKKIGYILMTTFGDTNVDEYIGDALRAMNAVTPLDGIILDNRHNSGGSSEVFINTLDYFAKGRVGFFSERGLERPLEIPGTNIGGSQDIPLVVIVGPNTASFAEIFSGILKDIGRAYIIGEQTKGNVEILSVFNFSDGSRAWIARTTFRPLNNPDQDWEQTGITPDLIGASAWDEVSLENDSVIQSAQSYFDSLTP